MRHDRRASDNVEKLFPGKRHLVLEVLRPQLVELRELALDPPRRQPGVHRLRRRPGSPGRRAGSIRCRRSAGGALPAPDAGTIASRFGCRTLDRRLLVREAVRIGRRHDQLPSPNRTRMPVRTGRASSRDTARLTEASVESSDSLSTGGASVSHDVGEPRKVLGAVRVQPVLSRSAPDMEDALFLAILDLTSLSGRRRERSRSGRLGTTTAPSPSTCASSEVRIESSMSVAASSNRPPTRADENAAENLDGRSRRDASADDSELLRELLARADDLES